MEDKKPPQDDATRLHTVLEVLRISGNKLATLLEYKSASSVYHVLEGRNKLSADMIEGIIKIFPEISYSYLKSGTGEVRLIREQDRIAQANLFGTTSPSTKTAEDEYKERERRKQEVKQTAEPRDPLSYNVATQLQMIIDNTAKSNALMEKLIEENIQLRNMLNKTENL